MKRTYIRTTLTLMLAVSASLPSTLALAQPPQSEESAASTQVRIELDAQSLGERANGLENVVIDNVRSAFEAVGVELVEGASAEALLLRIRFSGKAEDVQAFDYQLHFELIEGSKAIRLIEPFHCVECFDQVLFDTLVSLVPSVVEAIEAETQLPVGDAGAGVRPVGENEDPRKPPPPIGPLGGVGIGVATLGLGALVWGAVDLSRGRVYDDPDPQALRRGWTDYTPRGQALLGVGVASFAVGGALLITDLVIRSKRRKQHGEQTGVVVPLTSSQIVGLSWGRRF